MTAMLFAAWRVMSGSYRAAMADASRMEKRYEGRLAQLDADVSELRGRSEQCEARERQTAVAIGKLQRQVIALGGEVTGG